MVSSTFTLAKMRTDIGTWLGVDKDWTNPNYVRLPADVRTDLIVQARRRIFFRRDLPCFEDQEVFSTASGTQYNGLPSTLANDFGRPYLMCYIDEPHLGFTGAYLNLSKYNHHKLTVLTWDEYVTKMEDIETTSNARPTHYAWWNNKVWWYPIPDDAYYMLCYLYKHPVEELSVGYEDADDPFASTSSYDQEHFFHACYYAILFEACALGADFIMEGQRRNYFLQRAKEELDFYAMSSLRAKYSDKRLQSEAP